MAIKKETDAKSKIKAAVKGLAEKTADKVKKAKTATETAAKEKVAKVAEKKAATKSATLKTMKDAEEKAVKAVAKVKKAAATKVSKISDEVKKVTGKKTASKATAAKASEKVQEKAVAAKQAKASVATKASEKEVAKMAQSFDAEYLVLMQKDPNWMHAFWEVSENRINEAKKGKGKIVLRLFDIADDLTPMTLRCSAARNASSVTSKCLPMPVAGMSKIPPASPAWLFSALCPARISSRSWNLLR